MSITSDTFNTFYSFHKINNKSTIVFIHGVGLNKSIWYPQIDFFKNDYNILTYDLLGHGNTPLKKTKLKFEDYSKQLFGLINELNLEKIHLVGFSLGALIARNFASKYHDRLQSLIIHGSIYKRSEDQRRVVKNRFDISKVNRPTFKINALRRWFTVDFIKKNPTIHNYIYEILNNNNHKDFLKSYTLFIHYEDDDTIIENIRTNTLITTARFDVGSTPQMSKNLSDKIKGSKFVEIKKGKHLCSIECAKNVNIIFKKFIDQNNV